MEVRRAHHIEVQRRAVLDEEVLLEVLSEVHRTIAQMQACQSLSSTHEGTRWRMPTRKPILPTVDRRTSSVAEEAAAVQGSCSGLEPLRNAAVGLDRLRWPGELHLVHHHQRLEKLRAVDVDVEDSQIMNIR